MPEQLGRRGNMVLRRVTDNAGSDLGLHWWFWCPGCEDLHGYRTGGGEGPRWTRTGTDAAPSFSPSLLVTYAPTKRCHLYLRDGVLEFLGDSWHGLAGKLVPLPEPPAWLLEEGSRDAAR